METLNDLHKRIAKKFGNVIDLRKSPSMLQEILDEVASSVRAQAAPVTHDVRQESPFGISWMDSWVANWIAADKFSAAKAKDKELAAVLQGLVDVKFNQRIDEIKLFVRDFPKFSAPDGGPPEPGPGGSGPHAFVPPDAGPPEPGPRTPVGPHAFEPPDGGPPEPGVPDPPDPGPTGPDAGLMSDNPWILLWFVSVRTPLIIDMIDAHFTRRLNEMRGH